MRLRLPNLFDPRDILRPSRAIHEQLVSIPLHLLQRDRQPKVIQQQELQLELVELVDRQTSNLFCRNNRNKARKVRQTANVIR